MRTQRTYTPPPDPIYRAGKRKAALTKAITLLQTLFVELKDQEDINKLTDVILMLKNRRQKMEKL